MNAVRLHGPKDLRLDVVPAPAEPAADEVLIAVKAVGICGSDLHMYTDGRIGDTRIPEPLVLGHEFMGEVVAVGTNAFSGTHERLRVGQRVAVDPAIPDGQHEQFEKGHPNLCPEAFYGLYPDDGALQEYMICKAKNCFVMPDSISDAAGTLLETLGVAIHAVDLAKLKLADTVAVIGCGPVGLLILKLAQLSGVTRTYAYDILPWRVQKATEWGADCAMLIDPDQPNPYEHALQHINAETNGRGVDVAIEAAWANHSVNFAAELSRLGGRLVLVGIPGDDQLNMQHSTARRKGLTIMMSRRMKHTYPRAINLAPKLELDDLVSHRFALVDAPQAFAMNERYDSGVNKVVIEV